MEELDLNTIEAHIKRLRYDIFSNLELFVGEVLLTPIFNDESNVHFGNINKRRHGNIDKSGIRRVKAWRGAALGSFYTCIECKNN